MSKFNLLVHLNGYQDSTDTNNPNLNNFKWTRDMQGLDSNEPTSKSILLQPNQSQIAFDGTISTSSDATTTFDIALAPGSSNIYRISHNAGTAPNFRTKRNIGSDATTQVTITKNAKLLTFTASGGTLFDLNAGGVLIGDEVRIGTQFNSVNQGKFKIISFTQTSFTVENELGQAEGPITLGANFADEINIFSADGVQVGDKIDISSGFSSVSFGAYDIVDVNPDYIEILSNDSLPAETGVSNNPSAFLVYNNAKRFVYIESDKKLDIKINGSAITNEVVPLYAGTQKQNGIFMSSASIKSLEIINKDLSAANIFLITVE